MRGPIVTVAVLLTVTSFLLLNDIFSSDPPAPNRNLVVAVAVPLLALAAAWAIIALPSFIA
jgi:hypothetical protein